MIRIGTVLYGYCGGYFGRDSYGPKRVEAMGADWVVAREMEDGAPPEFADVVPEKLDEYTTEKAV